MIKELKMEIPNEIFSMLSKKRNGNTNLEPMTRKLKVVEMTDLYTKFLSAKAKLDFIDDVWWEEMNIEGYFEQPKWINAHAKRKRAIEKMDNLEKKVYYFLTATDGIDGGTFTQGYSMDAKECYEEFMGKYNK